MKKFTKKTALLCLLSAGLLMAAAPASAAELKVGVVDLKKAVESSKLGKQEQGNFDAMKTQMESVLGEKEKELTALSQKLQDADYLDSISADAETELKRKYRTLGQEFQQLQQQYYQVLQQVNFKVIQQIQEEITKAADRIASTGKYDLILNSETSFYTAKPLDITGEIVDEMDKSFVPETKENKETTQMKGMLQGR